MTKTVVVLGAGLAGLPIAHYLLRNTSKKHSDIRVVLVTPHDAFYWKLASVRFALPDLMGEDKYLFPLAEQFAEYPKSQFELVLGSAETLDPSANTVSVRLVGDGSDGDGKEAELREIEYHTLVVATGSRYADAMPWKEVGTTAQTRAAVSGLHESIRAARSIIVAGAGVTGVELAGELGSAYGKSGAKQITLVGSAADLPLSDGIQNATRATVMKELKNLRVKYVGGGRIGSLPPQEQKRSEKNNNNNSNKKQSITLTNPADGSSRTLEADLVIPTFGTLPNTDFAPASMLEASSRRLLQAPDLRAKGHKNIFVIGDAGHLQPPQAEPAESQTRHVMMHFASYFSSPSAPLKTYEFKNNTHVFITVGRDRGTGQIGTWTPFSLLIWFLKGRHLGTDKTAAYAKGLTGAIHGAWPK